MDTVVRHDESLAGGVRPWLWLGRVFPVCKPASALERGQGIGRDPDRPLHVAGEGVSRRHAEIYREGPVFTLNALRRLAAILKQSPGNVASAAALLGFARQRAYRLLHGNAANELLAESAANHGAHPASEDA